MGYRSEVAYIIEFESIELRNEYVAMILVHGGRLLEALEDCEIPEDSARINFWCSDCKWYDSYEDVKAHVRLKEWAHELYPEQCDWRFLRIGEENGDIEEDGTYGNFDPSDDFYPVTSMELPFSTGYKSFGDNRKEQNAQVK